MCPGTVSHTGSRVRDGHFKGPGPNRTLHKWDWTELNWSSAGIKKGFLFWEFRPTAAAGLWAQITFLKKKNATRRKKIKLKHGWWIKKAKQTILRFFTFGTRSSKKMWNYTINVESRWKHDNIARRKNLEISTCASFFEYQTWKTIPK